MLITCVLTVLRRTPSRSAIRPKGKVRRQQAEHALLGRGEAHRLPRLVQPVARRALLSHLLEPICRRRPASSTTMADHQPQRARLDGRARFRTNRACYSATACDASAGAAGDSACCEHWFAPRDAGWSVGQVLAGASRACSSASSSASRPIATRSSGWMKPSLIRNPPARAIASRSGTAQ